MSKNSKTKSKERRKKEKAARKSIMRARYEGFIKAGKNTKSKRSQRIKKKSSGRARSHPLGRCGNPGCIECYGVCYRPFLKKGEPKGMPQWMWLRWGKLTKEERKEAAA